MNENFAWRTHYELAFSSPGEACLLVAWLPTVSPAQTVRQTGATGACALVGQPLFLHH